MKFITKFIRTLAQDNYALAIKFTLAASSGSILFAYFVQYVLGYNPCILCLYQRIPFFIIIALTSFAMLFPSKRKLLFVMMFLTFIGNFSLALYHSGVERGMFAGTDKCSGLVLSEKDAGLEDIKELLYATEAATCQAPTVVVIGISMTEYNAMWNLLLAITTLMIIRYRDRNAKSS